MIQQMIRRLFGKKDRLSQPVHKKKQPTPVEKAKHHIDPQLISKNAIKVTKTLQDAGYLAYIVGGAVRDLLLGITPKDFDVATNATPDQVHQLFKRSRIIGKRFQIVHVTFYGSSSTTQRQEIIEVSTFRALLEESGEHIAQSGRILRDNVWGSQAEDAARRDFTINAMYYDPASERVLDYHHGMADIKNKLLRMIGDPTQRYREDPVRMLRVVRFAAKTQFEIEPKSLEPIASLAHLIHDVPSARLFDEMLKLLVSGHAWSSLCTLRDVGLDQGLLPMLDAILEKDGQTSFAKLALDRTDQRVQEGKTISPGFLFAALLWEQVYTEWQLLMQTGKPIVLALHQAIDLVLANQREVFAIQRRFETDMHEIWSLQPRFEKRIGKMPYRLIEAPRFRAGFDFLCLRCEAKQLPMELAQWWEKFQITTPDKQAELLLQVKNESPVNLSSNANKSRRRRRRGPKHQASDEKLLDVEQSP